MPLLIHKNTHRLTAFSYYNRTFSWCACTLHCSSSVLCQIQFCWTYNSNDANEIHQVLYCIFLPFFLCHCSIHQKPCWGQTSPNCVTSCQWSKASFLFQPNSSKHSTESKVCEEQGPKVCLFIVNDWIFKGSEGTLYLSNMCCVTAEVFNFNMRCWLIQTA